jgi:hypothetical protein
MIMLEWHGSDAIVAAFELFSEKITMRYNFFRSAGFTGKVIYVLLIFVGLFPIMTLTTSFSAETYCLSLEERRAIENRKKIQRYHIEVECSSFDRYHPHSQTIVGRSFFVDGDSMRYDTKYKRKVHFKDESDFYSLIHIWTKDQFIEYLSGADEAGEKWAVSIKPRDEETDNANPLPPDIRSLGFNPCGYLSSAIENYVGDTERSNLSVTDELLNGVPCKKIEYTHAKYGSVRTYWIAPSLGYSVIRMMVYYDGIPRESTQELSAPMTNCTDVEVSEYKNTGLWFPKTMNFVRTNKATEEIELKQEFNINIVSLNERIAPEIFTLKALNMPAGTPVMLMPESIDNNYFWDGYDIKSEFGVPYAKSDEPKSHSFLRTILILIGLGLICAACIAKYIELRQNNKKK